MSTPIPYTLDDRERLVRLETKLDDYLTKAEQGFPRCAVRGEKIEQLEGTLRRVKGGFWTIVAGIVLLAVKAAWTFFRP